MIENLTAGGATVLLTTHYLDEAQHLAQRVIVMDGGRVVADATPAGLRAMGGVPVIRYRLPRAPPTCQPPWSCTSTPAGDELTLPSADVTADLATLVGGPGQPRGPHQPGSRVAQPGRRVPGHHRTARARKTKHKVKPGASQG